MDGSAVAIRIDQKLRNSGVDCQIVVESARGPTYAHPHPLPVCSPVFTWLALPSVAVSNEAYDDAFFFTVN